MARVDPATKGNLLMFCGAMLVLAAFWLIVLGLTQGNLVQFAGGVAAAVAAVTVFRAYVRHIRNN
jgi:hypothetical protein